MEPTLLALPGLRCLQGVAREPRESAPATRGWFSGGAFLLNGLWEILFPARQFLLAQVVIVAIFVCAAVAYLQHRASGAQRLERG
jgi:hypothetical protein